MTNIIIQARDKINSFKTQHRKLYYVCIIGLWCAAPIEMGAFTIIKRVWRRYRK